MTPNEIVQTYFQNHYRCVFWPHIGDSKGPREPGWTQKIATIEDYHEGYRVGLVTGIEVNPGQFIHDIDIDWQPGGGIAVKLLPYTNFVFGRASKRISHCFYLLPEPLPSFRYEDIDKTCLLELRGTKTNGELGMQTMVPPSIWTKEGQREELIFVKLGPPTLLELTGAFRQWVCLAAVAMLLAKHLGHHGFGHEPQLAWAGFLLRLGIPSEDLITMGEAIGAHCGHIPLTDIRTVVQSTAQRLGDPKQKIKGGPALAKLIGENLAGV